MEHVILNDSASECTNCVEMKYELMKLKENFKSTELQVLELQTALTTMEKRVAILTKYLLAFSYNIPAKKDTESDETVPVVTSEVPVEDQKEFVAKSDSMTLTKLENRLNSVERGQFLKKADKLIQKYLKSNKTAEQCDEARKMHDEYKKNYDSFIDALKSNIQQIKQNDSITDLPPIPNDPKPFRIDGKILSSVSSDLSENDKENTGSSASESEIQLEISGKVAKKLQKLRNRLTRNGELKHLVNASNVLQLYCKANSESTEECDNARKQYEEYKNKYDSFVYALKSNIRTIEQNASLNDLLPIPNDPKPFKIVEKSLVAEPEQTEQKLEADIPVTPEEMLQKFKNQLEKIEKHDFLADMDGIMEKYAASNKSVNEIYEAWRLYWFYKIDYENFMNALRSNIQQIEEGPIDSLLDVSNEPKAFAIDNALITKRVMEYSYQYPKMPDFPDPAIAASRNMSKKLAEFKNLLRTVENRQLLKNAQNTLTNYWSSDCSMSKLDPIRELYDEYKGKYYTYVNTLKANIRKIERNEEVQIEDLLTIPKCPEPLKIEPLHNNSKSIRRAKGNAQKRAVRESESDEVLKKINKKKRSSQRPSRANNRI